MRGAHPRFSAVLVAMAWVGLTLSTAPTLLGCAPRAEPDGRPVVAVSVLPHRDLVRQLAGDRVRVEVMVPPGASPATFEPTLRQLRALSEADLYVKVGHPAFAFEATWLEPLLAEAGDLPVVDARVGHRLREGDPHVWLSPRNTEALAVVLAAALAGLVPEAHDEFEAALARFRSRVDALDAELAGLLAPVRGKVFLVMHPSFGYLADAYGLEQIAIEHDHREPDAFELERLIERAREAGVRSVFVQPQFDAAGARVIARELQADVVEIDPLAEDWEQNLREVASKLAEALRDA